MWSSLHNPSWNPTRVMTEFPGWWPLIPLILQLHKNFRIGVCLRMSVCIYAHVHPQRTLYCLQLSPALLLPFSACPWQITWILAACLRNNTFLQVDRGASFSSSLPGMFTSNPPGRRLSNDHVFSRDLGGWGRWDISAPMGNKGHLFNLWCRGSLQPVYGMQPCCYSAHCIGRLPAVRRIHYKCVVCYLTVSIGFSCWWNNKRGHKLSECNTAIVDYLVDYWMHRWFISDPNRKMCSWHLIVLN